MDRHDEPPASTRAGAADAYASPLAALGRPRRPPRWVWIVLAVLAAAILVAQFTDILPDHAVANVATWVMTFVGLVTLWAWFLFGSGYRRKLRWASVACVLAVLGVLAALFRIDHISGELVPTFVFRFSRKAESGAIAPRPDVTRDSVDLLTTTEFDFPQFLGPERDTSARGVKLARDWNARPSQLVWRHEIGAGWPAFAVVNGHAVTMEQRGPWEAVTCYNVKTGTLEWAHSTETRYERMDAGVGPRATPTIDEGTVYALGATGQLMCLEGATGKCRWEKNLLKEFGISPEDERAWLPWGRSNSPLVAGDLVIVPAGGPTDGTKVSLVAYDKRHGTLVWQGGDQQISYSSPAVARLEGVDQVLIVNEASAAGHSLKTGKVLWEYPWDARSNANPNVSQAVPVPPNRVLLSKGYGRGAALVKLVPNGEGTFAVQVVWKNPKVLRTKFTNVAIHAGHVYGLSDGVLECVALESGERVWKEGRYQHGQILRVGDLLLVLSESGELVLVEASPERANHVLGRFQALEGMTWNNFALYGPYVLVRNAGEAACYQLPVEAP